MNEPPLRALRIAVSALTGLYGIVVIIANARNDIAGPDFTRDWVLFGGGGDFPADFGRNVFAGSIALGTAFVVLAGVTLLTAGRPAGRLVGVGSMLLSVTLLVAYRDDGNLLAAKPSAASVLLALGFFHSAAASPALGDATRSG